MTTGLIHVKLKVRDLLSGIIVMTGLYSINLAITGNKANLPIFSQETIFENEFISSLPEGIQEYSTVILLLLIVLVVKVLLDLYMQTRSGYLLRAVGDNETLVTSLAKDKGTVKIIGLALANGLAASIASRKDFLKSASAPVPWLWAWQVLSSEPRYLPVSAKSKPQPPSSSAPSSTKPAFPLPWPWD